MNRKKKIYTTLKKKAKKANSKLQGSNKPRYISKADREKATLEAVEKRAENESEESSISSLTAS